MPAWHEPERIRSSIEAARAKPGELTLASVGPGAAQHIWFEMLKRAANIELIYVQYTGGAPAINALC
jgi:tripartite-type tricarboxylate transporter receptor subunit TctC